MPILMTIFIVLSVVFGGTGLTVYAAQDSAPDAPLYGIKLASEDARLGLTLEQTSRLELQLDFALRRMQEMAARVNAGQDIPASLLARWQRHNQNATQICAQLSDAEFGPALQQVREHLRLQDQIAANLAGKGPGTQTMAQVRLEIQARLQLLEQGTSDPELFRQRVRQGQDGLPVESPGAQNPWTTGTPTPGSSYGPGPGDCEACTPAGPQGSPEESGNQDGAQNPWTTGTPTPGSSYGPGPGDCETCTPQGPQGPQNGEQQPNPEQEPGGGSGSGSGSDDPGPQGPLDGGGGSGGNSNENGSGNKP